jgi:hypothetical protein
VRISGGGVRISQGVCGYHGPLLKVTFRLVRTILLTGFYNLKMVVASYLTSHSFSDRGVILPSCLACDLSAYAAHLKILICL